VRGRRLGVVLATLAGLLLVLAPAAPAASTSTSAAPLGQSSGGSPFSPGVPQSTSAAPTTTTAPVVTTSSTSSSDSGLSGGTALAIGIGAIALIGGIAFFIWHDARRRAPVRAHATPAGADGRTNTPGSKRVKPRKLSPAEKRRRKRGRAR
jgi:hypothetical protein